VRYRYVTCDVFTETRFGGNPLAVLPEAEGLSDAQMQRIAREFNYSETTFVLPPEAGHTRKVRIFTPTQEVPFAGHPNVGTAFVLATSGALGEVGPSLSVTFEEKAGPVPIAIRAQSGRVTSCELRAPKPVAFGTTVPRELVAAAVSLPVEAIVTVTHEPQFVSAGLPFLMAELRGRSDLERLRTSAAGFEAIRDRLDAGLRASLYLYVYARSGDDVDVRARMLAPLSGIPEDPATGSAGCAVVGLLAHHESASSGEFSYRIAQGVEMGRPSLLLGRASKSKGRVDATFIGGSCVLVSEGLIEVD
jgi:trans-2,3-dihydro-3-hydroxyanthranilate isomerase